jgi:hypothetical protein
VTLAHPRDNKSACGRNGKVKGYRASDFSSPGYFSPAILNVISVEAQLTAKQLAASKDLFR